MTTIIRRAGLAALLLAAGCSSQTHRVAPTPSSATPSSATPTSPAPTSALATKPGIPACTENIRVIPGQVEGAAGHRFLVLAFNNVSMKTCQMIGYPTVDLVDASGHLVKHVRHTLRGQAGLPAGVTAPQPVILNGGKSASAIVEASAIPQGNGPQCKDYALMVTPPGEHSAVPAGSAAMPDCDVQVHPVVAGDLRNR